VPLPETLKKIADDIIDYLRDASQSPPYVVAS
jgi:hypothetical protein